MVLWQVRPNAVALVDAFNYTDHFLGSILGRYDGNVYPKLYEEAWKDPLNDSVVPDGYHEYVRPLLKQQLRTAKLWKWWLKWGYWSLHQLLFASENMCSFLMLNDFGGHTYAIPSLEWGRGWGLHKLKSNWVIVKHQVNNLCEHIIHYLLDYLGYYYTLIYLNVKSIETCGVCFYVDGSHMNIYVMWIYRTYTCMKDASDRLGMTACF